METLKYRINRNLNRSNNGKGNNEQMHHESKSKALKPKLVCKKITPHNEMRKFIVKVNYNDMGEPVRKKILLDRCFSQNRGMKIEYKSNIKGPLEKKHVIIKRKESSYSFLDLTRTTHVLREVLLGKISRDIMYSRSYDEFSLHEMLRFFCETSFGATTIADYRQTDLFNAILALQSVSPFIRIMKRLLQIPGIQPFSKEISDVFFEAWSWFLRNDVFVDGEFEVDNQDVVAIDFGKKLKGLLISEQSFFRCLNDIQNEKGNFFSPYFISCVKENIQTQIKYKQSCNDEDCCQEYLDVDEILELFMKMMEQNEDKVAKVKDQLFFRNVPYNRILTPKHEGLSSPHDSNTSPNIEDKESFCVSLQEIKFLLDLCIRLDRNREGCLNYTQFKEIVRDWSQRTKQIKQVEHTQFKKLFELFEIDDDLVAVADYIEFVGIVYTIFLDEHSIPCINDVLAYFTEPRRGIDSHHYALLEEYVHLSYLEKTTTTSYTRQRHSDSSIRESRRTLTKIESLPNNLDFMSRWLTIGSLRNEYKNSFDEPTREHELNHFVSVQSKESNHNRPKTPLYLVEPQASFNHEFLESPDISHSEKKHGKEEERCYKNDIFSNSFLNLDAKNFNERFPHDSPKISNSLNQVLTNCNSNPSDELLLEGHVPMIMKNQSSNDNMEYTQELRGKYFDVSNRINKIHMEEDDEEFSSDFPIQGLSPLGFEENGRKSKGSKELICGKLEMTNRNFEAEYPFFQCQKLISTRNDVLNEGVPLTKTSSLGIGSPASTTNANDLHQDDATVPVDIGRPILMDGTSFEGKDNFLTLEKVSLSLKPSPVEDSIQSNLSSYVDKSFKEDEVSFVTKKGDGQENIQTRSEYFLTSNIIIGDTKILDLPNRYNMIKSKPKAVKNEVSTMHVQPNGAANELVLNKSNGQLSLIKYEKKCPDTSSTDIREYEHEFEIRTLNNLLNLSALSNWRSTVTLFGKKLEAAAMTSFAKLIELDNLFSSLGHKSSTSSSAELALQPSSSLSNMNFINLCPVSNDKIILIDKSKALKKMQLPVSVENDEKIKLYKLRKKQSNGCMEDISITERCTPFNKNDTTHHCNVYSVIKHPNISSDEIIHSFDVLQKHQTNGSAQNNVNISTNDEWNLTTETFELTSLQLLGKSQWEMLFEHNEHTMLSIISRFQSLHHNLDLSRQRHRPNTMELENFATYFSLLNRVERFMALKTKKKKRLKCFAETFEVDAHKFTLGVGIKSLLLSSQTRKCKTNTSSPSPLVREKKIQPIKYRISH